MENKELDWLKKRVGYFTSSSVRRLMSSSGKFTQEGITYLLEIEQQRLINEPLPPVTSAAMSFGLENEKYAVEYLRENMFPELIYSAEQEEIIFRTTEYGAGSSYDCWLGYDLIIEIKCCYSQKEISYIFSPSIPYEEKKKYVFKEHGDQLAVQLLCDPMAGSIAVFKYNPQRDDNQFDLRSPLDKSRGQYFEFQREDFDLDKYKKHITFANNYLNSGKNILDINKEWELSTKKEKK